MTSDLPFDDEMIDKLRKKSTEVTIRTIRDLLESTTDRQQAVVALIVHASIIYGLIRACAKPEQLPCLAEAFEELSSHAAADVTVALDDCLLKKLKGFHG